MAKKEAAKKTYSIVPFEKVGEIDRSKFKILSRPPIVKMSDMEVGDMLSGTIEELMPSAKKEIKDPLLIVALTSTGQRVAVPVQASIRNVLLDKDGNLVQQYLGQTIMIVKTGEKVSDKYKRKYNIYDVAVSSQSED